MRYLIFIFPVLILAGCNAIYVPATPSTPVFEKGNSFKMNATAGASGINSSIDYSFVTHFYLGAEVHGFRLQALDSNKQFYAGGHIGYYFTPGDNDSHLNFQIGYDFGNSHYASVFDSTESHLYSANTVYETYHAQAFYVNDFREDKYFGFGVRCDIYKGNYANIQSRYYKNSIPAKTVFPMAFIFFEHPFTRNSPWNLNALGGFQFSTEQAQDRDVSQNVPGFYTYFIARVGIAYQFHFGK